MTSPRLKDWIWADMLMMRAAITESQRLLKMTTPAHRQLFCANSRRTERLTKEERRATAPLVANSYRRKTAREFEDDFTGR